ncbi:hypothetical protein ABZY44_21815 [Streptomyces sp. NPDC006544]|uniref:hypothetical protein n=1 Tax=Streptomyces sp. NPDC006544 TaxID=3154583 RepID=UPI0033B58E26
MSRSFKYTCPNGSVITGDALTDAYDGPVIWLQADGHIPLNRLEEFIEALRVIKAGISDGR